MKAAVLVETGRIDIREVDRPILGPDDLLIKTEYSGVCGSDLHAFKGKHPFRKPPVILGHELAGTAVECGAAVRGFCPGDRVTIMPLVSCGTCRLCRLGRENICLNKRVPGAGAWLGSFAEHALAPAAVAYKLGEATPCELASSPSRWPWACTPSSVRRESSRAAGCWCSAVGRSASSRRWRREPPGRATLSPRISSTSIWP